MDSIVVPAGPFLLLSLLCLESAPLIVMFVAATLADREQLKIFYS